MSSDDRSKGTLLFDLEEKMMKTGEEFIVNFNASEKALGYQFTLNFNELELLEIMPGAKMNIDNFAVFANENALTTSFDGEEKATFALRFRAKTKGLLSQKLQISSRITRAEGYNLNREPLDIALRYTNNGVATVAGQGFELYQNQPNPFGDKTTIGFYLPETTEATLRIYDLSGRVLFTKKEVFAKGQNAVIVTRKMLESDASGALFYQLETATDAAVKGMILGN
jgi:hypothetical protein